MNLHEIDSAIEQAFTQAIDPETGEINEEYMKRLDELEMQRDQKAESLRQDLRQGGEVE